MTKTISIDPVTRIEGHAKVFLDVGEDGQIASAGLVVNELRGFERILVGMAADQMPLVTARICGVCPTAHHLAATDALEHAAGVTPPPAAKLLRELMYMGHLIHSHTLSLFVLQGPDLIMGLDGDPATRNIVGIVQANPDAAKKALRCRSLGQKINELVGGRGTHPVTSVAGGITFQLDDSRHQMLTGWADEALALLAELVPLAKGLLLQQIDNHPVFMTDWIVPAWSLGTVKEGRISLIGGPLRAVDAEGNLQLEFPAEAYDAHLAESVIEWSYMKQVHIRAGDQRHEYRVGPMARINVGGSYGTPLADAELATLSQLGGNPCHAVVLQTYSRLIELVYAAERARDILRDPALGGPTRVPVHFTAGRGVGHVEAPRGTLIHDYDIDDQGIIRSANLIVATQQNYASINRVIAQAAASHVVGKADDAALLNAVEFGIRCFDPCLSCATHALGDMPMEIAITRGTEVVRRITRAD